MADRVSSDHPSVQTIRATCTETTTGVRLELPADERDAVPVDDVVRVVLDDDERFAMVERALTGDDRWIRGVYETPSNARDPSGAVDLLASWVDDHDVRAGGSVLIDVVEPEFLYGLRKPGATAYYDAHEPPSQGLQDIARGLEDESTTE
ncbi:DUF7112 family protein [Natrarchaeobaculum sulfurireducens]|uniref:Uncharacterized protein n=1 Tax=Natrarchaeobaculum sulfurireducens TaxID=2044521 RepID=A0A346PM37_9EURY|nr:hypothetical protein [Natrarchaeobaculum sulfurireducens]AXR76916.1 hypothetical protein AArc1_0572 [Natrarchaeobaculum sulfurireducens]AXR80582.1 hypothetical protein AArcMg_0559 [Natrarchaeobaculum sulfurireducens]